MPLLNNGVVLGKIILIACSSLFLSGGLRAQGLNNNYPFDDADWVNVFEMQGISVFKFPFALHRGEYVSLSYEVWKNGVRQENHSPIEDFQREMLDLDLRFDHHLASQDTVAFHRIYAQHTGDFLNMRFVVPGIKFNRKIDIADVALGNFTAALGIEQELPEKTAILYYYGLLSGGGTEEMLECAAGLSLERMIADYDFIVAIFAERITKEDVKTVSEKAAKK